MQSPQYKLLLCFVFCHISAHALAHSGMCAANSGLTVHWSKSHIYSHLGFFFFFVCIESLREALQDLSPFSVIHKWAAQSISTRQAQRFIWLPDRLICGKIQRGKARKEDSWKAFSPQAGSGPNSSLLYRMSTFYVRWLPLPPFFFWYFLSINFYRNNTQIPTAHDFHVWNQRCM